MAKATKKIKALRVASRQEGFRRAGIVHTAAAQDYPISGLTTDQIALLKSEPMLVVAEVEIDVPDESPAS